MHESSGEGVGRPETSGRVGIPEGVGRCDDDDDDDDRQRLCGVVWCVSNGVTGTGTTKARSGALEIRWRSLGG